MTDFISAATAINAVAQSNSQTRRHRRANASNVVLVASTSPRSAGGYSLELTVENLAPVGISSVTVNVVMLDGELELDGIVYKCWPWSPGHAIASGRAARVQLPHLVRLGERSFDLTASAPAAYECHLRWMDDQGKRWKRVDGDLAVPDRRPPEV